MLILREIVRVLLLILFYILTLPLILLCLTFIGLIVGIVCSFALLGILFALPLLPFSAISDFLSTPYSEVERSARRCGI